MRERPDINEWLKNEQTKIHEEAYGLVSQFWEAHVQFSNGKNFGFLGCRARLRTSGVSIEWYNNYFTNTKDASGKKRMLSKAIRKGKKPNYSIKVIVDHKHRRDWEIEQINKLEPLFTEIRKRSNALANISRASKHYLKLSSATMN